MAAPLAIVLVLQPLQFTGAVGQCPGQFIQLHHELQAGFGRHTYYGACLYQTVFGRLSLCGGGSFFLSLRPPMNDRCDILFLDHELPTAEAANNQCHHIPVEVIFYAQPEAFILADIQQKRTGSFADDVECGMSALDWIASQQVVLVIRAFHVEFELSRRDQHQHVLRGLHLCELLALGEYRLQFGWHLQLLLAHRLLVLLFYSVVEPQRTHLSHDGNALVFLTLHEGFSLDRDRGANIVDAWLVVAASHFRYLPHVFLGTIEPFAFHIELISSSLPFCDCGLDLDEPQLRSMTFHPKLEVVFIEGDSLLHLPSCLLDLLTILSAEEQLRQLFLTKHQQLLYRA